MIDNKIKGIYVHIPFCKHICPYCDFSKVLFAEEQANQYLKALTAEMNSYDIKCEDIETIYIGGGTPSCLTNKQFRQLFELIDSYHFPQLKEYTVEVNAEDINEELVKLLQKYHINRVSIGVQSFDAKVIKEIKRFHSINDVINGVKLLKESKINNINLDMMYGFKSQTEASISEDLNIIKSLDIKHLSYYNLIVEPGTVFYNKHYVNAEAEFSFHTLINDFLIEKLGFEHYEVSNYCRDKNYALHNLRYWHNEHYFGFGLGACSYLDNERIYNTKSITNYNKYIFKRKKESYNYKELIMNEIMLNFRIFNGVAIKDIERKYSINFTKLFKNAIIKNKRNIMILNHKLYFTEHGQLFLNDIILDFMECVEEWDDGR